MVKIPYHSSAEEYPAQDFELVPVGDYPAIITLAEIVQTKNDGQQAKLSWQIVEGPHQGRLVWTTHTIINPNEKAEKVGRSQLQNFASSVGVDRFDDLDDLLNKPMLAHVEVKKGNPKHDGTGAVYPDRNVIQRAKPYRTANPNPTQRPASTPRQTPVEEDFLPDFTKSRMSTDTSSVSRAAAAGAAHASKTAAAATNGSRPTSSASGLQGRAGNPFA